MAPRKQADKGLQGAQKAAIVMMSVDTEIASKVFGLMKEEEIKAISQAMSSLGAIKPEVRDSLIQEFTSDLSQQKNTVVGTPENVEKLLSQVLGKEKVASIMGEIGQVGGGNTWEKLNNVSDEILTAFLKNEHPQTVAVVLSKLRTAQAAKVLTRLPEETALEVVQRMINLEPVKREILSGIEKTIQSEFMTSLSQAKQMDSYEVVAEIFNNLDRKTEAKYMELIKKSDEKSATRIRELMFTFDDLIAIDGAGIQALIRNVDKDKLPLALKGANDKIRELFFKNMSERAAKILQEDMEAKGAVRLKDVDQAQRTIVTKAKEMAEAGEIIIKTGGEAEEEMVY